MLCPFKLASNRKEMGLLMERMDHITGELKAKNILIQSTKVQVRGTDNNGDVYKAGMGRLDCVTGELNVKDIIHQTAKVQVRGT